MKWADLFILGLTCLFLASCSGFCSGIGMGRSETGALICPNSPHWTAKQVAREQIQDLADFKKMMNSNARDHGKPIPYPEVEPK